MISHRKLLVSSLLLGLTVLAQSAQADTLLFQTATLDPAALAVGNTLVLQGDGTTAGDGIFGGSLMIGVDFTVSAQTHITSIGAAFANTAATAGTGSIFGAIVAVDPVTGLPTQPVESLLSITLGSVVFTPTADGDTTAALDLILQPGTYGLVFGSGLYGAEGVADLLVGNTADGSSAIFSNFFAPFAQDPYNTDVRLFVNEAGVSETPVPGAAVLFATGGLMLALVRRRRNSKTN